VVSGNIGSEIYAAAPYRSKVTANLPDLTQVVVLTNRPDTGLRQALPWFLLAATIVLAVAAVVGDRLGRRISRPLRDAELVTRQIAAGDLAAQVPLPHHGYPELASLATSINTMAGTLSRSKGLERQFLLSVSHDLRTPLTSIRGFAEAIAEGAAPDNTRAAEVIAAEARRLERLVKDLLDLAQFDARRFSLDLRPTDLAELVADTGEGFRPAADELGLRLELQPAPAGAIVATADPDRLAQVVANLVENALKYARTRIVVGVAATADGAVIWVDDDGPGISAADLPRVFDRLFMSSRYPARQVGTGLGLAIVAELLAAMGGSVRAESPVSGSGGTRMVVTLPSWTRITSPTLSAV
jgi:two-component system sensor histidine kinase BaeS